MIKGNIFSKEKMQDTLEAVGSEIDRFDFNLNTKVTNITNRFLSELRQNEDLNRNDVKDMERSLQDYFLAPGCGIEWEVVSKHELIKTIGADDLFSYKKVMRTAMVLTFQCKVPQVRITM